MINEENFKKIIKEGEILNKDIVEIFGSDNIKKRYKENNKVDKDMKGQMLKKARRYCDIVDLGLGKYEITKVYDYPKSAVVEKMKKSLHQYIAPLILLKLLDKHDENNKVVFPLIDWAKFIGWINSNYKPIKNNKRQVSEKLDINIEIINEFFEKVDDNIRTYMEKCLDYLCQADTLIWYKVKMLHKRNLEVIKSNNIKIEGSYIEVKATDEEIKFVIDSEEKVRWQLGIKNKKECFYGRKADEYRRRLREELLQENILWSYDSYEVFYTNIDRCKRVLSEFTYTDEDSLVKDFNDKFIEYLEENAEKRKGKELTKELAKRYRLDDNYISDFKTLSELTIDTDQQWKAYKEIEMTDNFNEKMKEDFQVEVVDTNGNKII